MEALDLTRAIIVDRIRDREMTAGDFDDGVSVGRYHFISFRYI
jgi:hypothetical protein